MPESKNRRKNGKVKKMCESKKGRMLYQNKPVVMPENIRVCDDTSFVMPTSKPDDTSYLGVDRPTDEVLAGRGISRDEWEYQVYQALYGTRAALK